MATSSPRCWLAVLTFLGGSLASPCALAQPAPERPQAEDESEGAGESEAAPAPPSEAPSPPADPNALTPPRPLAIFPAVYPEGADAVETPVSVVLEIEIGPDGFVREASVREPSQAGFDDAARAALLRSVFEPATRGGQPIPARVLYRYDFAPKPAEPVEPEAAEVEGEPEAGPGRLAIHVLGAQDDALLSGVEVRISPVDAPDQSVRGVRGVSDAEGAVIFDELAPGAYEVWLSAQGYDAQLRQEQVVAGEVADVRYRLSEQKQGGAMYGAEARVEAPPREMTRRTIEKEALTRVAGTRGDALRTVELLPGVARPPFSLGLVIIRGSSPGDSSVLLDGVEVPLLYHFGGLTSFYNSRAIERIDFYPGNFSARYGRKTGGIVDVEVRDPATDGYHGVLDVNIPLDSSLLVEGPITEKASFMIAGRRSYFGEVLRLTIPEDTFDTFAAPVYYDAQALVTYRPTPDDRVRFLGYISGDGLELLFADASADDPSVREFNANLNFQRVQSEWRHRYSRDLYHDIRVSYARNPTEFDLGPEYYFDLTIHTVALRAEWRYQLNSRAAVTMGTDSLLGRYNINYRGPAPQQDEGNPGGMGALSNQQVLQLDGYGDALVSPSLFLETDLRPVDALQLILGLRLDYDHSIREAWFDPRLSVLYQLTEAMRLKAGIGMYSQPPDVPQSARAVGGNPNLEVTRSVHYGLGGDYTFGEAFTLGLDGFYKQLFDNVVGPPGGVGDTNFINDGVGRIYGLEVSGRAMGGERFFGFLSYTLMRSERNDRGEGWRPFDFDQRHILTLSGTYNFGNGWELGGTFRVVTGNPVTPVQPGDAAAPINVDNLTYVAEYGRTNSGRAPTFHRLDVRVQRKWTFDAWALAAYLDIQNVYNAKNPEGTDYNFDSTESAPLRGLPIVPIIGARGEM